jgi:uncharacterized membrane protein
MAKGKKTFGKFHPAVIAVYAAILAASALIPSIPVLGTGGSFSVSTALIPLAGVFFGPIAGALCAAIGGFIGQLIAPATAVIGIATFVSSIIAAFIAGLLCEEKKWGPLSALGIGLAFVVLWFTHPVGRESWLFALVFFGSGILCCILGFFFCNRWLKKSNFALKAIAIFIACYAGMIFSAAYVDYVCLFLYGLTSEIWTMLIVIAPLERALFAVGSLVVGTPLLIGLPKIGVFIGPRDDAMDAELPMEE